MGARRALHFILASSGAKIDTETEGSVCEGWREAGDELFIEPGSINIGELGRVKEAPGFCLGIVWRRSPVAFWEGGQPTYLPGSGRSFLSLWDIKLGIQGEMGFEFQFCH